MISLSCRWTKKEASTGNGQKSLWGRSSSRDYEGVVPQGNYRKPQYLKKERNNRDKYKKGQIVDKTEKDYRQGLLDGLQENAPHKDQSSYYNWGYQEGRKIRDNIPKSVKQKEEEAKKSQRLCPLCKQYRDKDNFYASKQINECKRCWRRRQNIYNRRKQEKRHREKIHNRCMKQLESEGIDLGKINLSRLEQIVKELVSKIIYSEDNVRQSLKKLKHPLTKEDIKSLQSKRKTARASRTSKEKESVKEQIQKIQSKHGLPKSPLNSQDEINRARKEIAKKTHPDINPIYEADMSHANSLLDILQPDNSTIRKK